MALVATGLTTPRSIEFDTNGNLLVVESGLGLTSLVLQDNGGACLTVKSSQMVIQNTGVSFPTTTASYINWECNCSTFS